MKIFDIRILVVARSLRVLTKSNRHFLCHRLSRVFDLLLLLLSSLTMPSTARTCHVMGGVKEENESLGGDRVLSVNTAAVNTTKSSQRGSNDTKEAPANKMGWFPNCCSITPKPTKATLDNEVSDSSLSAPFLILDGVEIISLGRVGVVMSKEEAGNAFLEEALEIWKQRLESRMLVGNVSYEYRKASELVQAAHNFASNVSSPNKKVGIDPTSLNSSTPSFTQNVIHKPLKQASSQDSSVDETLQGKQMSLVTLIKNHQFAKALNELCDVIDEDQEKRGADDLVVGMETKTRAVLHLLCGQKEQSMYFFHEYLLSKKLCFGEQSTQLADALNELGIVMYARGDKNGALAILHNALALFGDNDYWYNQNSLVPTILNNVGCAHYQLRGDHATALSFLQKACIIQKMALAESVEKTNSALFDHATTKLNIGHIYLANGNVKALPFLEDSLSMLQSLLGDVNGTVNNVQENIRVCKALMQERNSNGDAESQEEK